MITIDFGLIKPSLQVSPFGCCIPKGSPYQIIVSLFCPSLSFIVLVG